MIKRYTLSLLFLYRSSAVSSAVECKNAAGGNGAGACDAHTTRIIAKTRRTRDAGIVGRAKTNGR